MLLDKSPQYALDPESLLKAERDFDEPLYIHLVRHPYAMVRSFEDYHMDQVLFLKDQPFSTRQLGELVWTSSQQNILDFLHLIPPARQFRMSFEELTKRPADVMRLMCDQFAIPFHPDLLQPYKDKERKMVDGIYAASTPMGDTHFHEHKAINAAVADKWEMVRDDNFLSELTWQIAAQLGYDPIMSDTAMSAGDHRNLMQRQEQLRRRKSREGATE
jgi:hypothetical protein